jgi:hypothetical protein
MFLESHCKRLLQVIGKPQGYAKRVYKAAGKCPKDWTAPGQFLKGQGHDIRMS